MKRILQGFSNNIVSVIALLVILLGMNLTVLGQTPGLIIKPALSPGNSVLDPDGDGYVSQKTNGVQLGFTIPPDNDVTQSELPFVAIIRPDPISDILRGPVGAFIEIVGVDAAGNNAILTYNDGTNLMFRFRMGGYAPNSKSYSIMIDTDGKFGFTGPNADQNAVTGNPGFEAEIVLETNFDVKAFNVNGTTSGTEVTSYSYDTNCQKSMAVSTASGDPDYFYDYYLPLSSLSSLFTSSTPLRIVAVTVMNPHAAIGNNALSDVGGVTSGNNLDQIFEDLIDAQTPTVPGQEVLDRTACPTINTVFQTSTTISGTSTEASGTAINVYVYQSNGTTLVGSGTTTTSGSSWSILVSNLSGPVTLAADYIVKATATATGKGVSYNNCDIETVYAACTPGAAPVIVDSSTKGICGTMTAGAALNIYKNGILIYSSASTIVGVLQISGTSFSYKPNGSFQNCQSGTIAMPDGFYEVSQTVGGCESLKSSYSNSCTGISVTPVITSPIYAGTITIAGTSGASAAVELLIDGISSGTTTASVGGAWSFASITVTAGQTVKVIATETSTCTAGTSLLLTVLAVPTPVITTTACGTVTSVSGYITAPSGTVQIYLTGTPDVAQGSATSIQSNGSWTASGLNISSGTIYAKATLNGGITINSSPLTISTQTANIPAITTGTIWEGDNSLTGTGVDGDVISLYVGGSFTERTTTVSGGTWTISSIPTYEFYIGASVYVTATSPGNCEGLPSGSKVVQCVDPTTPSYNGGNFSYCVDGAGSIGLITSQTGVIYQLVNSSGVAVGPASIGTGGAITLTTNVLTGNLSNIFVKAYKIGFSSCSATGTSVINFTNEFPSPLVTFTTTSFSVLLGTTSVNLHIDSKTSSPSADTYTINYSTVSNNQGFIDITTETAVPAVGANITLTIPSNPLPGTYTGSLRVKETSGSSCNKYYDFTITVFGPNSPPIISVQPSVATICNGTSTTLSVTALSASGMTYQWEYATSFSGPFYFVSGGSGATTASYTTPNLSATTYYIVEITNSYGSTTSTVATVTVAASPGAAGPITGTSPVCAGQSSVAYSIVPISGATSYTWGYTGSNVTISGSTNSVLLNFASNATSGTLSVHASNACGSGAQSTLAITVSPTPFINNITAYSCSGTAFSVTPVDVTNGIVPASTTYSWPAPVVTGGMTGGASGSGSSSIGGTITNTTGSTQTATYTVTPIKGSCAGSTFIVTVNIYPPISLTATPVPVVCNGGSTGQVNLSASGGTPGYTYLWADGPTTQNRSALPAGTYSVTVTDTKSCTASTSATVTQSDAMVITPSITAVTCNGTNTGIINISVTGGTNPKTYLWNDGSSSQNRTGLAAGTYSVIVTDANGCTQSAAGLSVTQPNVLTVSAGSQTNVDCYGNSTGSITLSVSGGTGTKTYLWNDSNTNQTHSGLSAGTYSVTVTDANGCTATGSYTITQPVVLSLSTDLTPETCPGNNNGAINLIISGGTSTYTTDWADIAGASNPEDRSALAPGPYTVNVTDAHGCTASTTVTITVANANPVTPGNITK